MKSIIIKSIVFVALFFGADYLIGKVVTGLHLETNNINLRNANYGFLKAEDNDVLFFGASEVSHTFISNKVAEATGLSAYNLASDGCGILYQYALLKTILDKHTPKAILISSYQLNEEGKDYLTRMYPYYDDNEYVKEVIDEFFPRENLKLELEGYVYNSQLIRILDGRSNNLNGYVPLPPREVPIKETTVKVLPEGQNYEMSEESIRYFNNFLESAKASGAKVYVYVPPVLEKINETYHNKIKEITSKAGVRLIDFSQDNTFLNQRKLFNDRVHLNHEGAKIMNDKFIEILKADGVY